MYNLYNLIKGLCDERAVTIAGMCRDAGISKGILTDLKMGRKKVLSSETLTKISVFFGVSVDFLLGIVDKYGLTSDDWAAMGTLFHTERTSRGIPVEKAVDGAVVTAEQLASFEKNGTPLSTSQLEVICGLIGTTAPDLFMAWADRLYGQKNKPSHEEEFFNDDSIGYAAHQYDGDLTQRDKRLVVTFIKTLAEENRKNRKDGAT